MADEDMCPFCGVECEESTMCLDGHSCRSRLRDQRDDVLDAVEMAVTDAATKGDGRVGLRQTRALGGVLFKYRPVTPDGNVERG